MSSKSLIEEQQDVEHLWLDLELNSTSQSVFLDDLDRQAGPLNNTLVEVGAWAKAPTISDSTSVNNGHSSSVVDYSSTLQHGLLDPDLRLLEPSGTSATNPIDLTSAQTTPQEADWTEDAQQYAPSQTLSQISYSSQTTAVGQSISNTDYSSQTRYCLQSVSSTQTSCEQKPTRFDSEEKSSSGTRHHEQSKAGDQDDRLSALQQDGYFTDADPNSQEIMFQDLYDFDSATLDGADYAELHLKCQNSPASHREGGMESQKWFNYDSMPLAMEISPYVQATARDGNRPVIDEGYSIPSQAAPFDAEALDVDEKPADVSSLNRRTAQSFPPESSRHSTGQASERPTFASLIDPQAVLHGLYIDDNCTLKQMYEILQDRYTRVPSERTVKRRLQTWGIGKNHGGTPRPRPVE